MTALFFSDAKNFSLRQYFFVQTTSMLPKVILPLCSLILGIHAEPSFKEDLLKFVQNYESEPTQENRLVRELSRRPFPRGNATLTAIARKLVNQMTKK